LFALVSVAAVVAVLSVVGCSKDCPTCPNDKPVEHYKGWFYYTQDRSDSFYGVYKIDMETDSVVDSINHEDPELWPLGMDVSGDGRFLAIHYSTALASEFVLRVFDAQTLTLIRDLPGHHAPDRQTALQFDTENNLLLEMNETPHSNYLRLLRLPTFELIQEDTIFNLFPRYFDVARHVFYANAHQHDCEECTQRYPSGLYSYDYLNRKLEYVQPLHPNGDTLWFSSGCVNRAGNILYFRAGYASAPIWGTTSLAAYDLTNRQMLWIYPNMSEVGGTALSPDEKEVWMTDQGPPGFINNSGTIYVLDAATGTYLQGMSMYGYSWNPLVALSGGHLIFSPTGEKAYVNGGYANDRWVGSILVVDAKQKKITKILSPDLKRRPIVLRIGPKT
jgi:hypothetical protein